MDVKEGNTAKPLLDFGPIKDTMKGIIKVIGVGGGGCNAVRNMFNETVQGVTYAVCNTDSQSLAGSPVPVKILLGESGLGAGANPELGRSEAESNREDIERLLSDGTQMVFITAGMGGGTGTGAAPVIAGIAKSMGILTVGVVTIPFYFEKKRKIIKALRGVDELRKNVDALLIVNNERLCDVYADSNITIKEAFQRADNILTDAVKGISELITVHSDGGINLDFRDVETTMRNGSGAIMAMGRASGERRVEQAIIDALDSPLLYGNDIGKAKRILFNIYASDKTPIHIHELLEIDDFFDQLDPNIDVIWGTSTDNTLEEDAKVTILATGLEDELRGKSREENGNRNDDSRNTDDYYEELIPILYKPQCKKPAKPCPAKEPTPPEPPTFIIEEAPKPEPAIATPHVTEEKPKQEKPITAVDKLKAWLLRKTEDVLQDE
ncbi:MAG: cell division protein FtsZ [Prevotella sp.]|nr:cell division protein FtsZ [Prevotella sp.]